MRKNLLEKLKESVQCVLPIGVIILILHFTLAPLPGGTLALMLVGMVLLLIGLTLFSLGTDMAMMPMGEHVGAGLLSSRKLPLLVAVLFVFGFIVTAAEPALQLLSEQVTSIPSTAFVMCVSVSVGIFLVVAALRVLLRWKLNRILLVMYPLIFILAIFSSEYLAVSFDASAVTTGPVTVPFLLAIGAGFAAVSAAKDSEEDNFGICAICSLGPIIAVLILGMFYDPAGNQYSQDPVNTVDSARELVAVFGQGLLDSFFEVLMVLVPMLVIFLVFQIVKLKLSRTELVKIFVGLAYLLVGLTIFLAGVNCGFMPAAIALGETMGALEYNWILIPLCLVIGACVVMAEPAVHVLNKQVEEITNGAISRKMMLVGMAVGMALAMSLAMVRILFDISIWWILVPGYALALLLTFLVPKIFVGIGFDSGGIAAGAMSAAFVLPFTIGVCNAIPGREVLSHAFGVVGLIAMMPSITVQVMGLIYKIKLKRNARLEAEAEVLDAAEAEGLDDPDDLEIWSGW